MSYERDILRDTAVELVNLRHAVRGDAERAKKLYAALKACTMSDKNRYGRGAVAHFGVLIHHSAAGPIPHGRVGLRRMGAGSERPRAED